ncbi:hypothetical protein [Sagittula sp. SSi028]|uniref:hypothetical protein n=1 Tax=Sagittula sp. SSi028 TaxID=3400636 RepID=UPI003AF4C2B0
MRVLAISLALLTASAGAAFADKGALAYCQAQANGIAYTGGAKTGYAAEYNAAVEACLYGQSRPARHAQIDFRQPRNTPSVVGHCPPGIGPFYRGTLYCLD